MEKLIDPIPVHVIESELTPDKFVRKTNYGNNDIYIFNHHNAPYLTLEVGRLRELTFRKAGGGTGKSCDLDNFDLQDVPYNQLIVWSPEDKVIVGGYRFLIGRKASIDELGNIRLATYKLFNFSDKFIKEYLPYTVELGRSFVHPEYQSGQSSRKSIFALDNLWDGLGAIVVENPDMHYFFGKVTMYTHYNQEARNILLYFIKKHFPDPDNLLTLIEPLELNFNVPKLEKLFPHDDYSENKKILNSELRKLGENVPPLINAYMNLSPTMRTFGTSVNHEFGDVEETAILIDIRDIYKSKIDRHINTYRKGN
ncbi:MAG TPA: GNAT family N-acyltransferase [Salinivirgaceae bacterium]|nr:GNAT family N-acyltransferase [Salinivirgaceae bacterium]HQA75517.1 GNAT family N-acyltransferase [Salinivirgaceae bacterium]